MSTCNVVIDLSHHNGNVDFQKIKADGIVGVIHKATQGIHTVDPCYAANRKKAKAAGLLWGAYHFATGAEGVAQAQHFLQAVAPAADELLVLDLENDPQGPDMDLVEARAFVTHVHKVTGRWPGLYSGHYIKYLLGNAKDPVLKQCWLWLAQYGPTAVIPPNWGYWTMWQYTDGSAGPEPHAVAGVGHCDRDLFNGDANALRKFWLGSSG